MLHGVVLNILTNMKTNKEPTTCKAASIVNPRMYIRNNTN